MRLVALLAALLVTGSVQAAGLPPWEPTATEQEHEQEPEPETATATNAESAAPVQSSAQSVQSSAPVQSKQSAPRVAADELPPVPIDPNDAPFMRPPNNQIATAPPRTRPDIRQGWSARRRFAFTLAPAFASLRMPFLGRYQADGRSAQRIHGAGVNAEFDVQVWRWIWVRALGVYSGHPVGEERAQVDMQVIRTAPPGTIHVAGAGFGPVFALDLGRFLPLIEVGVAGLRVVTPNGGEKGQRGESCLDNGACDVGLRCNSARICEVRTLGQAYLGLAVDVLVRRHLSFGAQFRYNIPFAQVRNLNIAPGYLLGTVRLTVRF